MSTADLDQRRAETSADSTAHQEDGNGHASSEDQSPTELRLALVLNGGVSLAVWIGAATHEIDALRGPRHEREGDDSAESESTGALYETIQRAVSYRVVIDLIAGTSAGGINGSALAAAIASGRELVDLRNVWLKLADFFKLLRDPESGPPPALLRGDDVLLEQVRSTLDKQFTQQAVQGKPQKSTQLFLTGTDIDGVERSIPTVSGKLAYREHRILFRFAAPASEGDGGMRFRHEAEGVLDLAPETVGQLARAARSTASFPGAFEPSKVDGTVPYDGWLVTRDNVPITDSRWVIDGGVLDNSPIGLILDAIQRGPRAREANEESAAAERAIVFVVPYGDPIRDTRTDAPIDRVIQAARGLPARIGLVNDFDRIRSHFEQRRADDRSVKDLLRSKRANLLGAATATLDAYCARRWEANWREYGYSETSLPKLRAQGAPWLPTKLSLSALAPPIRDANESDESSQPDEGDRDDHGAASWRFDSELTRHLAAFSVDALRAAQDAVEGDSPGASATRARLEQGRAGIQQQLDRLNLADLERRSGFDVRPSVDEVNASWNAEFAKRLGEVSRECARILVTCFEELRQAPEALVALKPLAKSIRPTRGVDDFLARFAFAHIIVYAAGAQTPSISNFSLLRIDADPWGQLPADGEACLLASHCPPDAVHKLLGMQLRHFGAFLFPSWRANDWLWGRLDCAPRLVELILSPYRLRTAPRQAQEIANELVSIFADLRTSADDLPAGAWPDDLRASFEGATGLTLPAAHEDEVIEHEFTAEIFKLRTPRVGAVSELQVPQRIWRAVAWRIQLEIIRQELGSIGAQVAAERRSGAAPTPTLKWAREYGFTRRFALWKRRRPADQNPYVTYLAAFANYDLPLVNRLSDQRWSDSLQRTKSRFITTGVRALGSTPGVPGPVRRLARVLWPLVHIRHIAEYAVVGGPPRLPDEIRRLESAHPTYFSLVAPIWQGGARVLAMAPWFLFGFIPGLLLVHRTSSPLLGVLAAGWIMWAAYRGFMRYLDSSRRPRVASAAALYLAGVASGVYVHVQLRHGTLFVCSFGGREPEAVHSRFLNCVTPDPAAAIGAGALLLILVLVLAGTMPTAFALVVGAGTATAIEVVYGGAADSFLIAAYGAVAAASVTGFLCLAIRRMRTREVLPAMVLSGVVPFLVTALATYYHDETGTFGVSTEWSDSADLIGIAALALLATTVVYSLATTRNDDRRSKPSGSEAERALARAAGGHTQTSQLADADAPFDS
jgi:predicted acylesterase/phospholipase RssA